MDLFHFNFISFMTYLCNKDVGLLFKSHTLMPISIDSLRLSVNIIVYNC